MEEFERTEIKEDPVLSKFLKKLVEKHIVANHTKETLLQNAHIKNFCEEARHFVVIAGETDLFIHYDVSTWFTGTGFQVRVERICFYDNFLEFERARVPSLHSNPKADGANLN